MAFFHPGDVPEVLCVVGVLVLLLVLLLMPLNTYLNNRAKGKMDREDPHNDS